MENLTQGSIGVKLLIIAGIIFIPMIVNAESIDEVLSKVHSPEELENFYNEEFQVVLKIPDAEQPPEETLNSKSGDCDDFAQLTQAILKRLGTESEVVYIKFKDLEIKHAICAWKNGKYYNYFNVKKLIKTKMASMQEVLDSYYLGIECCTACTRKLDMATGKCEIK